MAVRQSVQGGSVGSPRSPVPMTALQVERERDARLDAATRDHDAKNNAKITRNNAGDTRRAVYFVADYSLATKDLRLDIAPGAGLFGKAVVNTKLPCGPLETAHPASHITRTYLCARQGPLSHSVFI